jgi:D-sedoheptulose 7-phosphate isomerase
MSNFFIDNINEHLIVVDSLRIMNNKINEISEIISGSLSNGGKIMLCGNGGSAADSQHIASELTGRFIKDRIPLAALALSTDSSALTCIGNDYSFGEIFSRQVIALGKKNDILIAISTSGNSNNVIRAVESANQIGVVTIGLLGRDGGSLKEICNHSLIVPSSVTARIQECHILIGHTLCQIIERNLNID